MQYLVTARKAVTLNGVLRNPGEIIEDPENASQLIRRGLAVPLGAAPAAQPTTEQAETSSPSSEPAPTSSAPSGDGEGKEEAAAKTEGPSAKGSSAAAPSGKKRQ